MSRFRTKIGFDVDHLDVDGNNTLISRLSHLESRRVNSVSKPFTDADKIEFEGLKEHLIEHISLMTIEDLFPSVVVGSKWDSIVTALGETTKDRPNVL